MQNILETIKKYLNMGSGKLTLGNILIAAAAFFVCVVIIRIILRVVRRAGKKSRLDDSAIGYVVAVVRIALYFVAVIIVCDIIGIPISSLIAVFSIVGLAISLSVQDLLSNLVSGFVILITKPFVGEDYVDIGTKSGKVKEVGFMHTVLLTFDNKTVYLPNKEVCSSDITNYTRENIRRVDLSVCASYEFSAKGVRKSILAAVSETDKIIGEPAPFVGVAEYGSSAVRYDVRVWCKSEDYWDVYYSFNEEIKTQFDRDGIEMTYDHLNIHMINNNQEQ